MKILVADDSKTTLTLLKNSLNKLGHEVIAAHNGQEAIELFQIEHPDLIILDVVMEGIDGFECARRIRALNVEQWIPIIFLSGTVDDENVANGINAGGDDYLTKPYSEITLAAKIKAMQRIADMRNKLLEATKKLAALSSTDALTGINNRLQFDRIIKEKISHANRYNAILGLLFIDLDFFKAVNDTLGHHVGDQLLKEVATRLRSCLRLEDFIARIGGDEFAVILADLKNKEVSGEIAKKIIHEIKRPFNIEGNELQIGCSIGIATYTYQDGISLETLINNADIAMYFAKESGRNTYKFFSDELHKKHYEQINLENTLKNAMTNNELQLLYQPILNLTTKKITRMEVLTSWVNERLGRVSASLFIPLAEEIGLIDQMTTWILRNACEEATRWFKQGNRFIISINLSPRQLMQKNLFDMITHIIEDTRMPIKYLEFELTETSPLIYSSLYADVLNKLYNLGIHISLDDFGTSYSSLSHLRNLPINAIKIDKCFIKDVANKKNDAMLVKSLITLGHNLGFEVIAEGIENQQQLDFLINNKCKEGQGFFLCEPKSFAEITELMQQQKLLPSEFV